jgi:hypothetical protein
MDRVSHPRHGPVPIGGHALYKSLVRDKRPLAVAGRVERSCQLLNLSGFVATPRRNACNGHDFRPNRLSHGSVANNYELFVDPDRTIRQQPSQLAVFFQDTRQSMKLFAGNACF